jgi:hypothetical protein
VRYACPYATSNKNHLKSSASAGEELPGNAGLGWGKQRHPACLAQRSHRAAQKIRGIFSALLRGDDPTKKTFTTVYRKRGKGLACQVLLTSDAGLPMGRRDDEHHCCVLLPFTAQV